jgi:pyruvate dehydrogenase E2 component (dihydrolipoamide acetyltransferase)
MARYEVKLPPLGDDGGDEATVNFFFPQVGESIKEGDELLEMVTDKATFVVPSPISGKLVETRVKEDDVVKVGEVLAIVETPD